VTVQTYVPTIRYQCPLDCGWYHDAPPATPDDNPNQYTQAPDETFQDLVTRMAGDTVRLHVEKVDAALLEHLETHTIPQFVAKLAEQRDAVQRVRELHQHQPDADYCDVCSNHGDIDWPCATIRALDGTES
jgi:hypothetical protein